MNDETVDVGRNAGAAAGDCGVLCGVPRKHSEGVRVGDAKIGVEATTHEKLPAWVGGIMVAGGIVMMVAGGRGR
jgi:hypothetical protein